ncbi:uncharacterized protein PGTG_17785 [Puccinia graminis f. sp. tritici CRL 75-36-700-3]|uniref:MHYT domain-containing protein n=1 Tax=Puccinia graminis f. sp. tritici (strain CRL 75-36-700-3 / race SCCL) TaxID=418459 RepID=E3L5G0_PUCGT|nr:uncharacterized protein PGTG_17785 [Puccinia graminis f. sp. tritici CRL 75-36-700-3]EFP91785.1 hypothetical protein PGTG_17785 [Puccinia graminis f. sp. tritici CRL 75-36-700-3]
MALTHYTFPNTTDPVALAIYYQTHPLPQTFNAGIVVASIVASFLGAETTLLLLSRRTSTAGARNWGILVLAATTMGSVGIWGMHFIGMNFSLTPAPGIDWYIQFSPGFTVLSLFVPMFSLVFAFVFIGAGPESLPLDDRDEGAEIKPESLYPVNASFIQRSLWPIKECLRMRTSEELLSLRIVIGGLIVGGTVALMHYSAGFSSSFEREYDLPHLVFSIILACVASTLSLLVFFRFQAQWHANWWKKMICSLGLAAGVSGMHYLGLVGTRWYVPRGKTEGFTQGKQTSTVLTIAISVMCFGVCVISFIIVFSDFLVTRESRRKARRVTIASATFDKSGRVLVNPDGMLPMGEVETDFPLKDIIEELNFRQPTFQWLYSLSWDWTILDPFLPRMAARALGLTSFVPPTTASSAPRIFRSRKEPGSSYTSSKNAAHLALFKDRCLETTQSLANQIGLPVSDMGVFFDNILRTGTRSAPVSDEKAACNVPADEESSVYSVAVRAPRQQGVMLFLVRELSGENQDTIENYLKRGYRFTDTRWFSPVLADRAAVDKDESEGLLNQLKLYAKRGTKPCVRSGGIYVGFFAVRPSISREGGIDTLVYQFARHQIPAYRLPDVEGITDEMRSWIGTLAGCRMSDLSSICANEVDTSLPPPSGKFAEEMWIFKSSLALAMDAMAANLKMFPNLPSQSVLSAEVIDVPSSQDDSTQTASMIVFQATFPAPTRHGEELPGLSIQNEVSGVYKQQDPAPTFVFVPHTLFSKTQMMMLRGNQARKFARECRAELAKRFPGPLRTLKSSMSPQIYGESTYLSLGEKGPVTPSQKYKWLHDTSPSQQTDLGKGGPLSDDTDLNQTPAQLEVTKARYSSPDSMPKMCQVSIKAPLGTPKRTQADALLQQAWRTPEYEGSLAPAYSPTGVGNQWVAGQEGPEPCPSDPLPNNTSTLLGQPLCATPVAAESGRTRAQPLAITARLRSDDWPTRCLHGLEQSEAGQVLLGVDW